MIDLAWKMLRHDRVRFAITVAGVSFAATLILAQIGLFLGLLGNANVVIDHAAADLWVTPRHTATVDFASTMSDSLVRRVRGVPGVARADNLLVWFVGVSQPGASPEQAVVWGLEDFAAWGIPWSLTGAEPRELRGAGAVLIDDAARRRFAPYALGERRELDARRTVRLAGTTHGARSFTTIPLLFMDLHHLQALDRSALAGRTNYILVRLAPGADSPAVQAEIARRLPDQDVLDRAVWSERCRRYWVASTGLGANMAVTAVLGAIVAVLVVAQTLYASAIEHRREFATVRAIGAGRGHVFGVLLRQALYACLLGLAAGSALGGLILPALAATADLTIAIPGWLWAWTIGGTVAVALLAAVVCWRVVAGDDPALVFRP